MLPPPSLGWNFRRTFMLFMTTVELKKPSPVGEGCPLRSFRWQVLSIDSPMYR